MIEWSIIAFSLPKFFEGMAVTLMLMLISVASGFLGAVPLAVARVSPRRWLSRSVWVFTYVWRGTPLLVQLFLVYFGLAQFESLRESVLWPLFRNAWFCAWFAFTLNTMAYTTEIFAGALKATPIGEIEAARSLGLSGLTLYRRILLPGALRRALPQYSNEVVGMMHATAIASTVSLVDLTRVARDVYAEFLLPVEAFGTVAAFYFVLTFSLVGLFKLAEKRWLKHLASTRAAAPAPLPDGH